MLLALPLYVVMYFPSSFLKSTFEKIQKIAIHHRHQKRKPATRKREAGCYCCGGGSSLGFYA